jgi:hypothetical protein
MNNKYLVRDDGSCIDIYTWNAAIEKIIVTIRELNEHDNLISDDLIKTIEEIRKLKL